MRDSEAGSRSRPFLLLSSHAIGVMAAGVCGQRRWNRRAARRRRWHSTSAGPHSLASEAPYASKLSGSRLPVLTRYPFLGMLECAERGGDAGGTHS